ncbi:MAG: hypothetical protein A2758_02890 [Candidatus Zambryskibacteria bacterium RIFCSPHIGHO2_01_FULL_49_18]|uniref:alanine--tRNA ligase n=2 Tax=Candidatus Zambryskiibacteriota TaxID=1817925 RepID=A0A1G2T259_9BACT|nr:MAG: hypothetical protein A2758_02890 [Candidatus Zambryskibacteria bacterium RIFCSPHIGHO2_01_FULL_49_18]OHB05021.1 MAG: hypothetical protein A3A26_00385 [Candidatus Zambryskibacteria bacterium RIFCSPLOWO2_01_FULL_47_14]
MNSADIRQKFLEFFKKKGHAVVPSSSLIPENDPTTLFTGSGMQPMVPYLLGEKHPLGTRIVDSQKCFRAEDIDEVGDNRHTTFFEMLGNWSFGDYFRKDQLKWISEFLFDEIKIDPGKLYVTVFGGDEKNNLPKDTESVDLWKKIFAARGVDAEVVEMGSEENGSKMGMRGGRIFYYDSKKNWWSRSGTPDNMPVGEPGGPDSEMFYEFSDIKHDPKYGEYCHPNCDCGRYLEIGNNVFMTYKKVAEAKFELLPRKNIDFGGGLERITAAANNKSDIFSLDVFASLILLLRPVYDSSSRIVADHVRASAFLIADGILPSNTDKGYVLRRLLRRAYVYAKKLPEIGEPLDVLKSVANIVMGHSSYKNLYEFSPMTLEIITDEINKFEKTLEEGLKQLKAGEDPFILVTSYGFPIELIKDLGVNFDENEFNEKFRRHQEISKAGSEQKFKGGLAGHGEAEVKLHTATHLLHQALHDVLGDEVMQKGSNITPERLRFDFSFPRKMRDEEKKRVEEIVNEKITASLPVQHSVLQKEEAIKTGARHFFDQKYPDEVSVYYIGETLDTAYSKEFCGGPHVENTGILGKFRITNEESSSAGVRRIKAVLE